MGKKATSEKDFVISKGVLLRYKGNRPYVVIPTEKSVCSSKSNNLPDWDVYFKSLAKAEYNAYLMVNRDEKAASMFNKCSKENLNNEEIRFRLYRSGQSEEHFTRQLEEIVLPIYESARNMGFSKWVYQT